MHFLPVFERERDLSNHFRSNAWLYQLLHCFTYFACFSIRSTQTDKLVYMITESCVPLFEYLDKLPEKLSEDIIAWGLYQVLVSTLIKILSLFNRLGVLADHLLSFLIFVSSPYGFRRKDSSLSTSSAICVTMPYRPLPFSLRAPANGNLVVSSTFQRLISQMLLESI